MTRTRVKRTINAPVEKVFKAVADIPNLPEVIPDVVSTKIISDIKSGAGTCFRETRLMKGKESITELEITEYKENESIRMVADSHGTVWDSRFLVKVLEGNTELELTMDAKSHKILPKLIYPLMKNLIKKELEKHMDAVKSFCEK
jgi:uncharacterized membrane protein